MILAFYDSPESLLQSASARLPAQHADSKTIHSSATSLSFFFFLFFDTIRKSRCFISVACWSSIYTAEALFSYQKYASMVLVPTLSSLPFLKQLLTRFAIYGLHDGVINTTFPGTSSGWFPHLTAN